VTPEMADVLGNGLRGEHQIDGLRGQRRARHAVVLRRRGLLGNRDSAHRLDIPNADRPVGPGAGQDDADGPVLGPPGK
jgi:hypothetical protein